MAALTRPHALDLLVTLVERDLKLRYRRSLLGALWSQLAPLVLLGVITFVFLHVVPLHVRDYPLFVVVGLLAWTWFATATVAATDSVVAGRDVVRRPGFPASLLPAAAVTTHLAHFVLSLPVLLVVVVVVTGRVHVSLLALPIVVLVQFAVTLAPAYVLAAMNVRYRDVSHIVNLAMLPLFYATPVFYPASLVPSRYRTLYGLNPLEHLFRAYRDVLLDGRWPAWGALTVIGVAAVAVALLSRRLLLARAHEFAEDL